MEIRKIVVWDINVLWNDYRVIIYLFFVKYYIYYVESVFWKKVFIKVKVIRRKIFFVNVKLKFILLNYYVNIGN